MSSLPIYASLKKQFPPSGVVPPDSKSQLDKPLQAHIAANIIESGSNPAMFVFHPILIEAKLTEKKEHKKTKSHWKNFCYGW